MSPLERATLSQRVASAIKTFIIDEQLAPGDKLPSEPELGRYFQVSRLVVREALQALAAVGILRVQHGRGAFVEPFRGGPVAEQLTFGLGDEPALLRHMLEVRIILETGAIELAALRVTDEDRAQLRAIIEQMRVAAERGQTLESHDRSFHHAIVAAARNPALSRLGSVIDEFFALKSLAYPPSIVWRGSRAEIEEHVALFEAISAGAPERARQLLRDALAVYDSALEKVSGQGL